MKVVDRGRRYELTAGNTLAFVQKGGGQIIQQGTTNEEVLEVLIDRVTEAYQSLPCEESIRALHHLQETLVALRTRTARRIDANVEGTNEPHDHYFELAGSSRDRGMANKVEEIDYGPN
jgi:hypothetical protein